MAVRLGWLFDHCLLHCGLGSDGRRIPHLIPRHQSCIFRYLGFPLASLQSRCHGLHLVRRAILDRRRMRLHYAPFHLAELRQSPQRYPQFRNDHGILSLLLSLLVVLVAGHLVPRLQDPTFVHGEIIHCACCWGVVHGVGNCQSRRSRSDRSSRVHGSRKRESLGVYWCYYGLCLKFRDLDCQRS